jgi:hypothetical protein
LRVQPLHQCSKILYQLGIKLTHPNSFCLVFSYSKPGLVHIIKRCYGTCGL